jgi:hypothetical protein
MALATFFLLACKLASRRPQTQEQLMIMWGLFFIGGCVLLGATSHCARRIRQSFLQPGPYLRRRNNEDKQSDTENMGTFHLSFPVYMHTKREQPDS